MSGRTAVISVVAALWVPAGAAAQAPPSVAPLAGAAGCVSVDAAPAPGETAPDCVKARALRSVSALALTADERHLYAASMAGAVVTLSRAADTGALSFAGCVSDTGEDGRIGTEGFCADGDALAGAAGVLVSPDDRFVYALGVHSLGIAWLERDPATGLLTPRGCLKFLPRDGRCGAAPALERPSSIALSPDGRHLYLSSRLESSVTWYERDENTGALSYGGCISNSGSDGACVNATALDEVSELAFAPDGATLYAASGTNPGAVTALTRDPSTGALALRGCTVFAATPGSTCSALPVAASATGLAVAPQGSQVLMVSSGAVLALAPDSLAMGACFAHQEPQGDDREQPADDEEEDAGRARRAQAGPCAPTRALAGLTAVAVSRDGRAVYVSGGYFTTFRRDPATGALEPFACLESYPQYNACAQHDKGALGDIVTTADGRNVYATSEAGIAVLGASVAVLNRTARLSRNGRIGVRLGCPATRARPCRGTIGRSPYRVIPGATATVQVKLTARRRATVRRRGRVAIVVAARDADRLVRAAGRKVLVSAR